MEKTQKKMKRVFVLNGSTECVLEDILKCLLIGIRLSDPFPQSLANKDEPCEITDTVVTLFPVSSSLAVMRQQVWELMTTC